MPKVKKLSKGIQDKLNRIQDTLDRIECGRPHDLRLSYCADYIGWLAQFKKVPEDVWSPLCDRITQLYNDGFGLYD